MGRVIGIAMVLMACGGEDWRVDAEDRTAELYCVWWTDCWLPAHFPPVTAPCVTSSIGDCSDAILEAMLDCFENADGQVPEIASRCETLNPCVRDALAAQCLPL